jgi:hypothetical protein
VEKDLYSVYERMRFEAESVVGTSAFEELCKCSNVGTIDILERTFLEKLEYIWLNAERS